MRIVITPEAVEYVRGHSGVAYIWEEDGGRGEEYRDLSNSIDVAMGRKPWQISVLDYDDPFDSSTLRDHNGARQAQRLLEAAAAELLNR